LRPSHRQHAHQFLAGFVLPDHADATDFPAKRQDIHSHASRPAGTRLAPQNAKDRNGRFGTDPFRIAADVTVQHVIAHQRDLRMGKTFDDLYQMVHEKDSIPAKSELQCS